PPRCLLSFPTRRSSDLSDLRWMLFTAPKVGIERRRRQPYRRVVVSYRSVVARRGYEQGRRVPEPRIRTTHQNHASEQGRLALGEDRKSTRLNSSHVKIS